MPRILVVPDHPGDCQASIGHCVFAFQGFLAGKSSRDPKDNKYLELALAAGAETIVSSDEDLLVLHPWRSVRILRPADYLTFALAARGR